MNGTAVFTCLFILICWGICLAAGYFSIPEHRRKPFQEQMIPVVSFAGAFLFASIFLYFMIDRQNISVFFVILISLGLGITIIPVSALKTWTK